MTTPPTSPAELPALARYRALQDAALARYGTRATSRLVQLADPPIRIHVLEAGEGAPVLLVHGGAGFAANWEPLFGALAAAGFRAIALDRPGAGLSDALDYAAVDLRQSATRVLGSLLDALGLARVALVGNSHGGFWSLSFALAHQERLTHLALIGAPAGIDRAIPLPHRLRAIPLVGPWLARRLGGREEMPSLEGTRRRMGAALVADPSRVPAELAELSYVGASLPANRVMARQVLRQITSVWGFRPRYYLRPELPRIRVPTLFIWGERDVYAPPRSGLDVARRMLNARVVVVPDAGHHPWWDHPDQVAEATVSFLRGA